jgi:hypothetical protein
MSDSAVLAEFQDAAVKHITSRLTDLRGSRRFLLADEVGLGKTICARHVIQRLAERHAEETGKAFNVVYLCSNTEIAEQNREKLVTGAARPVSRVTQLALKSNRDASAASEDLGGRVLVRLFSFTPGTSLYASSGQAWERQLLLYLVGRVLGAPTEEKAWRRYFACNVDEERWLAETEPSKLEKFDRNTTVELQRALGAVWRQPGEGGASLAARLRKHVETFDVEAVTDRSSRNEIIRELRSGLQRVTLDTLAPHLVILDEVQRFKDVISVTKSSTSLESRLFAKRDTAVLILSATPYKLFTLDHEREAGIGDHYEDFFETLRFLFRENDAAVDRLRTRLTEYGILLETTALAETADAQLRALKRSIEADLKRVMCRTERNWYVQDLRKGIEEVRHEAAPNMEELEDFFRFRRFSDEVAPRGQPAAEYWKSCPAVLTFMDHGYQLSKHAQRAGVGVPRALLASTDAELKDLSSRSQRLRALQRVVFGDGAGDARWKYLWVEPSLRYHRDEFFRGEGPTKVLVFSSWRFVPKAISILLSAEAMRRVGEPSGAAEPLRFGTSEGRLAFHPFDVCFPAPTLARLVPLTAWPDQSRSGTELVKKAAEAIERALLDCPFVTKSDTNEGSLWQLIARIEACGPDGGADLRKALRSTEVKRRNDASTEGFGPYRDRFLEWLEDRDTALRFSAERLNRLARIAVSSPAVCLTRALWTMFPAAPQTASQRLLEFCLNELRRYFNRDTTRAVIHGYWEDLGDRAVRGDGRGFYTDRVLRYCRDAHLQAVLDEYLYFAGESTSAERRDELLDRIGTALGILPGAPRTNGAGGRGLEVRLEAEAAHHTTQFALAFGDEAAASNDEEAISSKAGRRTAVREAFNSPFWPFVLSTTSVGQEGLDFHLYCRDIMHWNLPANPVDLEQREGRINRRNCLAVRRSIAADCEGVSGERSEHPWKAIFDGIKAARGGRPDRHGLFPHWIYERDPIECTFGIRRHLGYHELSRDKRRYEQLKEELALYRLVFGQPRQQDLLQRLRRGLSGSDGSEAAAIRTRLPAYMINLSPLPAAHAERAAAEEARRVLRAPERRAELRRLLDDVSEIITKHGKSLAPAQAAIHTLTAAVHRAADDQPLREAAVRTAAAALIYLRDPYDREFDFHGEAGFADDLEVLNRAAAKVKEMGFFARPGKRDGTGAPASQSSANAPEPGTFDEPA